MPDAKEILKRRLFEYGGDRRFALLVNAVEDYAIFMLDPDGYVSSWNPGAERVKGYSASEIIGRHFSCLYTDEDREAGVPELALRTARKTGSYKVEAWRQRKSGERFCADVSLVPIVDEDGAFLGFVKITRDLSERVRAQAAVAAARDLLAQSRRMDAVGRLTGGVAHDFNNLLTVIRGNIDLLQRLRLTEERPAAYIAAISDAAERASSLTAQLLAFARRQALKPVALDCRIAVEALLDMIKSLVGPNIKITLSVPYAPCPVMVDPGQLDTAIINLVLNARDSIVSRGDICISVARELSSSSYGANNDKLDHVAIVVEDTGTGIAPDHLPEIFEPFFTTKAGTLGTGLGLSQVFGFIKQSGGDVSVKTEIGAGTAFTLTLPLSPEPLQSAVTQICETELHRTPERVLVVDDNEAVGRLASEVIVEMGCTVMLVTSGRAALDELGTNQTPYDLVFTDIVMPGMTGLELGAEIRRTYPGVMVALTSGYSDVMAQEVPIDYTFLQKPYTARQLVTFINKAYALGSSAAIPSRAAA